MKSTPCHPKKNVALNKQIKEALRHYHDVAYLTTSPLTALRIVQQRLSENRGENHRGAGEVLQTLLGDLLDQLEPSPELAEAAQSARVHTALVETYRQGKNPQTIYRRLNISRAQYYRDLDAGIQHIARLLHNEEQRLQTPHQSLTKGWQERLPPPTCTHLFGVQNEFQAVQRALTTPERQWLVVIDGIGGIGKTTLARQAVTKIMIEGHFVDAVWVTAQTQEFIWGEIRDCKRATLTVETLLDSIARQLGKEELCTWPEIEKRQALQTLLHQHAYLIIVDNLETAADYQALAQELWALTNPSKVLITSRRRLNAYDPVTSVHLGALSFKETRALIHYQAEEKRNSDLATADNATLRQIYAVTGGHPLSLKLVLGQSTIRPLAHILAELGQAKGSTETLYRFIYWAAWKKLSPSARQLLLGLPMLAVTGGPWEALVAISGLKTEDTVSAVTELARLSLLEITPGPPKQYSIHQLTRQFVLSELITKEAPEEWRS